MVRQRFQGNHCESKGLLKKHLPSTYTRGFNGSVLFPKNLDFRSQFDLLNINISLIFSTFFVVICDWNEKYKIENFFNLKIVEL